MVQRIVLVIVLLLMIGLTVFGVIYVAPMITGADTSFLVTPTPTPTPIPTPTPTPTPSPTPTPVLPTPTPTPAPFISGQEAYLIDADTGQVFYSMNATQSVPIASTTKIMTALVAIENVNLEQGVTVQQADLDQVPNGSSSAGLVAGDYFRLRTLLYGLMLRSGTDASIVIARVAAGSTDNFVAMMNSKAQALGLTHTHYSSPHGFSSNNYSSAIDLVTLANYALRNPTFASIVAQSSYTVKPTMYTHEYQWTNTNSLLTSYPGADGVKTGWTDDAGVCLVFSARRNGHHLIGVELHAPDYPTVFADSAKLLDLGFSKE